MTSNLGAHLIQEKFAGLTTENREDLMAGLKIELFDLLRHSIRPEFLNRIDEIILFTPLNREEIRQIVELQITSLQKLLEEKEIHLSVSEAALDWLGQLGYDPQFGARPLKRVLQRKVVNELSKKILSGDIQLDTKILLDLDNKNNLQFVNQA
jgi:ATP-dependent Clp protease ATP-binding subunit ClpB